MRKVVDMFKKIKSIIAVTALSAGLAMVSAPVAQAFSGFTFGMNNQGPFMMFSDGPQFWHFNMNHPFGRYGTLYNQDGYGGYNNGPWSGYYGSGYYGGGNRYGRFSRWPATPYGGSPWSNSPWSNSPWGYNNNPWNGPSFGMPPSISGLN